ncbi:MAG: trypsin-like peptidase domain-containing protein [Bacteroidia bacterium]|nr:trypsin-like peptidase domain-containing protein [Bacteroidia bacterium]
MFTNEIITSNIPLARIVIDFFTAEATNPELFKKIKEICVKYSTVLKKPNGVHFNQMGYFSLYDFGLYIGETQLNGGAFSPFFVEQIVNKLSENYIIILTPDIGPKYSGERRFKSGEDLTKFLYERDLILNLVCGWKYIINKYSSSVVKIEHKNSLGDPAIGTGFYFGIIANGAPKDLIITNKLVVEKASEIKVLSKDDGEIKFLSIIQDCSRDLAFIVLENELSLPAFHLNSPIEILSEIITIGYPSIPMTKFAYQLVHRGEVNTYVEDYSGNQLFLFSAKTSSGNSGSPIIDRFGMIAGIVTEELFEKEAFYQKGKLPYYAAIPAEEIMKSLAENFPKK